jgi:hypothetical protein
MFIYEILKVICSGQEIDLKNDVWTVIGASGKSIKEGDLVSLNDIIGFKHQATGCYLHSHDTSCERFTPISKQQQGIFKLISIVYVLSCVFNFKII